MQKKISLLSTLLLLTLALGVVSFCTSTEAVESFKAGQAEAISDYDNQMSLRNINVRGLKLENKFGWLDPVLAILLSLSAIYFVWLLLSFIIGIKDGDIFVESNERNLKLMAVILIFWFVAEWITEIINFIQVKSVIAIEGYRVAMEHPSFMPLALGIHSFSLLPFSPLAEK